MLIDELSLDFHQLFLGGRIDLPACVPLLESMQFSVDEDDALDIREDVLSTLAKDDMRIETGWGASCDHDVVELDVMRIYCEHVGKVLENNDVCVAYHWLSCRQRFFASHVKNWIPACSLRMSRHAKTDFSVELPCW